MITRTTVAIILVAGTALLARQTPRDAAGDPKVLPPVGIETVSGTVVSDDTASQPVRRVVVTLPNAGSQNRTAVTDDQGRFTFDRIPAGHYVLSATKMGWVTSYYGSRHPGQPAFGGADLVVGEDQPPTPITLRLPRGSVVAGTVRDPFGRPMSGASVFLIHVHLAAGRRVLDENQLALTRTNDLGAYRLYGLAPGNYLLSALAIVAHAPGLQLMAPDDIAAARRALQAPSGSAPASTAIASSARPTHLDFAPVFFPGTIDVNAAQTVVLGPSEERDDVDVPMILVHTARVQGVVHAPDGRPVSQGTVQLAHPASPFMVFTGPLMSDTVPLDVDGTFVLPAIPPGDYTLVVRAVDPTAPVPGREMGRATEAGTATMLAAQNALWAEQTLSVQEEDLTGLALTLQHGATIKGQLKFEGRLATPDLNQLGIILTPVDPRSKATPVPARIAATGAFQFASVAPGSYRLETRRGYYGVNTALRGWSAESAMSGDVDALDRPIQVTLNATVPDLVVTFVDQPAQVVGVVTDASGQPARNYRIVIFTADRSLWGGDERRIKPPVPVLPDGTYTVSDLPGGEYFLAAVTDVTPDDLKDDAFLGELAKAAIPISLRAGEHRVQNVRLRGGF